MQETSGTAITDTIGTNGGTISGGYTLNQNGGIACSNSTGSGCSITTPTNYSNPQPMTLYADFAGSSGGILQLGPTSSITASPSYVLFLDNHGKLTFGVGNFGMVQVVQSSLPYADGNRHKAVVSIGTAGAKLYVDGSLVATGNITLANFVNGYWFFGGINTANWQLSPAMQYFNGTLYTVAWWSGSQLTDAQGISLTGGSPSAISNSYCTFTNQIASLNPAQAFAFANKKLTFAINSLQLPGGGSNLPIGPSTEVCQTDSSGNILAGCQIPQGARVNLSVGNGPPISLVVPFSTSCDLTAIMLSQTDPPEVVSAVATAGPLFAGAVVTNPPAGNIGTATITSPAAYSQTQATAATVDIGVNGNVQQVVMTGNVTVNLTDFASGANFTIDTTEDGTGGRTPSFTVPAGWTLNWMGGGTQPAMPSTAANVHTTWNFTAVSGTVLVGTLASVASGSFPLSATANFNHYSGTNINQANFAPLTAPTPSVTATCSGTCATTYTYEIACVGDNSSTSAVSSSQTSTNAASLSGSNYNTINWSAGTGCYGGYAVYGRIGGSLGLLATCTGTSGNCTATSYKDDGSAVPGAAPPAYGNTGAVISSSTVHLQNGSASSPGVAIDAPSSQSADLLDLNVNGVNKAKIDQNGNATVNNATVSGAATVSGTTTLSGAVTANGALTSNAGHTANSGLKTVGSINVTAVGTPSAPSIVSGFTAGTTDYYFCAGEDSNGNDTIPSNGTGTTGTTGTMSCGGQTGAVKYYLLRTTSSGVPIGTANTLVGSCATTSGVACNVSDANNTLTSYNAQSVDQTGQMIIAFPGFFRSTLIGGTSNTIASPAVDYFPISGLAAAATSESAAQLTAPLGTTLKNLNCSVSVAPGTSNFWQFILRRDGTDAALMCQLTGAQTACYDRWDTVASSATHAWDIEVASNGSPLTAQMSCSVEVDY